MYGRYPIYPYVYPCVSNFPPGYYPPPPTLNITGVGRGIDPFPPELTDPSIPVVPSRSILPPIPSEPIPPIPDGGGGGGADIDPGVVSTEIVTNEYINRRYLVYNPISTDIISIGVRNPSSILVRPGRYEISLNFSTVVGSMVQLYLVKNYDFSRTRIETVQQSAGIVVHVSGSIIVDVPNVSPLSREMFIQNESGGSIVIDNGTITITAI